MDNYKVNFTTPEAFTNSTADSYWLVDKLDMAFYSIASVFGLPTHSYIIWLIVTKSGVSSEFFNFNLSVCEIGSCLNSLLCILDWFLRLRFLLSWFLFGLTITGRPLFQCLMCVERYLAVVHPITFLKYKPLRYRVMSCSAAWIMTLGSCLCCIVTINSEYKFLWFFSAQFLFFLSIQLFCLVAVLRALKHSGPGDRKREKEENHMKRRAFHLILITTMSIIIIYVPFSVSGLIAIVKQQVIDELIYFCVICFALGGFIQPVLYLQRAGKVSHLCCL